MAYLYRLILAALLVCFAPAALADGGPFAATPGQFDTSTCNASLYQQDLGGAGGGAWSCSGTSNPNVQSCGVTYSNGYFDSKCNQQRGPSSCPAGATSGTGGDGSATCTCGPGLIPFNGTCKEKPQCDPGFHEEGGACVPDKCKPDETRVGTACVKDPPCEPGKVRVGKECKPNKCKKGASAGDYTDISDSVTYLCEMSNGLNCQVRIKPTICVKFDGQESCTGEGMFTGATCSGGNGGTGGGTGNGDGGNPGTNPGTGGTGGTGTGGTGSGGTGTGGTGTGGTGTGGGGTGTGGTGTGGTGTGGTGTGGTGTGDGGTGTGGTGTGTGGTGTGGTGSGTPTPNLPPPKPVPPAQDGKCPTGMHKSGEWCINDPAPPDNDGKCPDGTVKINGKCYSTEPGGGGTGTGGGGTGSGDGDGDGEKGGFGGSCMSGFACEGDAIQCAIAKEQYRRNCQTLEPDTDASSDYNKAKNGTDGFSMDKLKSEAQQVNVGTFDSGGFGWAHTCPPDPEISVPFAGDRSISIPFSRVCGLLDLLSIAGVGITLLGSLVWVLGGKNNRGYARVSTKDQETHLQLDALAKAGVLEVRQEKGSSVGPRPELHKLLSELKPGDVLVVYKMDRVARSLKDLLSILDRIKASGAAIRSLTEPLDTSSPLGIFMIQILGAVGQLERSITRERTVAGQVAAIKRGVTFGRPKLLTPEQEQAVLAMVDGGATQSATARHFGVSLIVVRRLRAERAGRKNTGLYPVLKDYL